MGEGKRRKAGSWNLPSNGGTADKTGYVPGRRFLAFTSEARKRQQC
jgi:hypothetical protein